MPLTDNNGTQYYGISCGVPSGVVNINSNTGSAYYWLSANDYILYGQPAAYPGLTSNNTRFEYLYRCNVPSDAGLNLTANNGTKYYYSSSFNCVSFCDNIASSYTIQSVLGNDMNLIWDEWKIDSGMTTLSGLEYSTWTGSISGNVLGMKSNMLARNRSLVYSDHIEINGLSQAVSSRFLVLSTGNFGGNQARSRKTFWVMETNFHMATGTSALENVLLGGYDSSVDYNYLNYVKATSAINQYVTSGVYSSGESLSTNRLSAGGTHTYIIETGSLDNGGGIHINGIPIPSSGAATYWSRDQWAIGTFRWDDTETQYNKINIKLKAVVFMKHPDTAAAIPVSATQLVRTYLTNKYGVTD